MAPLAKDNNDTATQIDCFAVHVALSSINGGTSTAAGEG
jgi:hypothetical protein